MKYKLLYLLTYFVFTGQIKSQEAATAWDNTLDKSWPEDFTQVEIKSTFDGKVQKAVFYKTLLPEPQPLIVSLHTWSGDYSQEDPLSEEIVLRSWNYIHPDFRGPNNNPEACGSVKVVSDIKDAIRFAIKNANVDTTEVHIIGVSGGGYATLLSFMKLDYPVKSFHAWAPVTNLENWYWECRGRGLKYARDLESVTTGGNGFDVAEARKRSPELMDLPIAKRKNSVLRIHTGIHDGYTGSVPVTHSINMFNHLVSQIFPVDQDKIVLDSLKLVLLEKRMNPAPDTNLVLGGRKVHLYREVPGISLTIFEGGHEMIVPQALALLPILNKANTKKVNILTVGDSNGAAKNGWPNQLKKILPFSTLINQSVPGNTIGFDNLNNPKLNTLRNMKAYLDSAFNVLQPGQQLDYIVFGLGTNDAKKVFNDSIYRVSYNLDSLLNLTKEYLRTHNKTVSEILIVSPPPINEKIVITEKYGGGNNRIDKNNILFKEVARKHGVQFIDVNTTLKKYPEEITVDGVHLTSKAQFKMAEIIANVF